MLRGQRDIRLDEGNTVREDFPVSAPSSTAVPNDSDKMLEEIMVRYAGAWKALADK